MIDPEALWAAFEAAGVRCATGVPDSVLKGFCNYLEAHLPPTRHIVVANEGAAIGLAVGQYLSLGQPTLAYLQNAGLGNVVNPILSIASKGVYGIPLVMLVGWRGCPGESEEPQHRGQGAVTEALFRSMGVPFTVLSDSPDWRTSLMDMVDTARRDLAPTAILVRRGVVAPYQAGQQPASQDDGLTRSQLVTAVVGSSDDLDAFLVVSTGYLSREVSAMRTQAGADGFDFLNVGGMGHVSQIALGAALGRPEARVVCLEGDGSTLMHLGSLATIGSVGPPNLIHVIANNRTHESVGGMVTAAPDVSFRDLCKVAGYQRCVTVNTVKGLLGAFEEARLAKGPTCIEVMVGRDVRAPEHRPAMLPAERAQAIRRTFGSP